MRDCRSRSTGADPVQRWLTFLCMLLTVSVFVGVAHLAYDRSRALEHAAIGEPAPFGESLKTDEATARKLAELKERIKNSAKATATHVHSAAERSGLDSIISGLLEGGTNE